MAGLNRLTRIHPFARISREKRRHRGILTLVVWSILLTPLAGCRKGTANVVAPSVPLVVPVSQPVEREVIDFVDFTGRINAVQSVDIRPRVTGYLRKMPFKEGAEVKQGDVLFEVDSRPYEAQVESFQSQVRLYQAQLKLARVVYSRDLGINSRVSGSISQQQLDQHLAAIEEAEARVKSAEKNLELFQLNVEFSKITSPIDGQVSRYYLTVGNLVNQDQTLLTTVVSLDPIHAYFDMDEPTLLRIRQAINEGRLLKTKDGISLPVFMGVRGEEGFPQKGTVNFFDNQVNPTTGSIPVRGVFPNPEPKGGGVRLLSPGMFVRIRLPIGTPHKALLVIDRAVSSDQGLKFVYVLDSESKVQYRRVTTGAQQSDGLRVIEEGLKPDDWVITSALLQVRPRMKVESERVPMPTLLGRTSAGEPVPAGPAPPKSMSPGEAQPKPKPAPKNQPRPAEKDQGPEGKRL
jgi:multidrug efflux system membrane fusion protein